MSSPQNQLYRLADNIHRLCEMFEPDNDEGGYPEDSIFDIIKEMRTFVVALLAEQQRLENQMNIIIKLLGKDEKV